MNPPSKQRRSLYPIPISIMFTQSPDQDYEELVYCEWLDSFGAYGNDVANVNHALREDVRSKVSTVHAPSEEHQYPAVKMTASGVSVPRNA